MAKNHLRTPSQVKADFLARGESIAEWAEKRGYAPLAVYQVLNGYSKGNRGKSHQIAVDLGIKANQSVA